MSPKTPRYQFTPFVQINGLERELRPQLQRLAEWESRPASEQRDVELRYRKDQIQKAVLEAMSKDERPLPSPLSPGYQQAYHKFLGLEEVTKSDPCSAVARAHLFFSGWAPHFAHGPDSLLPVTGLAETVLQDDEKITMLSRVTWREPLTHDLILHASAWESAWNKEEKLPPNSALNGIFTTNHSREIHFHAIQDRESPITRRVPIRNPTAQAMIGGKKAENNRNIWGSQTCSVDFSSVPKSQYKESAAVRMSTVAENLTLLISGVFIAGKNKRMALMAGINNLLLPDSLDELVGQNIQLRLQPKKIRIGKSGFHLLPFEYRIGNHTIKNYWIGERSTGLTAFTNDPKLYETYAKGI